MAQCSSDEWELFGSDSDSEEGAGTIGLPAKVSTNEAMVLKTDLECGGSRGFVAKVDLEAGRLLVAEVPWVTWPEPDLSRPENLWAAAMVVLGNPPALHASTALHPLSLDTAEEGEADAMLEQHGPRMAALFEAQSECCSEQELVLLLLRLHHNGFASGLYTRLSIFNHSCEPNVIKFSTASSTVGASECWTTRPVKAGEATTLTLCIVFFVLTS